MFLKIRPKFVHGRWSRRLNDYGPVRNIFEDYKITEISELKGGYTAIQIRGPRKVHQLISCARPLTIISPPEVEGGNASQNQVPLYFVSPMNGGSGQIQGATYFAVIDDELVAYQGSGSYLRPL